MTTNPSPIGTIMPFAGPLDQAAVANALKAQGWLHCAGQAVAEADYPELYALIGTTYGGQGSHFQLPDPRGRLIRGFDPAGYHTDDLGSVQGSATALPETVQFTTDPAGAHSHAMSQLPVNHESASTTAGHDCAAWNDGSAETTSQPAHDHVVATGGDAESRPINVYVYFIIKAKVVS